MTFFNAMRNVSSIPECVCQETSKQSLMAFASSFERLGQTNGFRCSPQTCLCTEQICMKDLVSLTTN
jgi:hypothetical protein